MSQKQRKKARREAEAKARSEEGKPSDEELEKILSGLTNEEAEMFVAALELSLKKRRLMFQGYMAALVALLGGILLGFWLYGRREPGEFIGWAFLIGPAAAGALLWLFGRASRALKPAPLPKKLDDGGDGDGDGEEE